MYCCMIVLVLSVSYVFYYRVFQVVVDRVVCCVLFVCSIVDVC